MSNRYEEMDYLRGIAILMVILAHSVIVYPINLWEHYPCYLLYEFIRYLAMPTFFAVSGFCFSYKGGYGNYIVKKMKRVLVPHLAFGLIELFPRIIPNPFANKQMAAKDAVVDFLLYGGTDWFLTTLFVIFVIFPVIHLLFRRGTAGKGIAVLIVATLFMLQDFIPNIFQMRLVAINLVYYMAGYLVRQWYEDETFIKRLKSPVTAAAGFVIMAVMLCIMELTAEPMIIETIGSLGGIAFFYYIGLRIKETGFSFFTECSKYSLQMYLLNGYALVAARTFIVTVLGVTQPVIIILFNFTVVALTTLLISKFILDRFKPLRFISGL